MLLFTSFSKTWLTTERRLTGQKFSAVDLSPTFFYTETTNETFPESGKRDHVRQLLKSSASIYEISGSQFLKTTIGIQSGRDAFEKSKMIMTFLTILRVSEIWCDFRLVLEAKTVKEIPKSTRLEFLQKLSANNSASSGREDCTSGLLNRKGVADLPLLRTLLAIHQKFCEPIFFEVMDFFVWLAYASLATSSTLLQQLLACLNFTLDSEDLSFWYKWKKWFLWAMAAAKAAENHGDEWGLTWYFLWGIYTSIPTWTHSQNSLAAAEALSLKISSHGRFLKWS